MIHSFVPLYNLRAPCFAVLSFCSSPQDRTFFRAFRFDRKKCGVRVSVYSKTTVQQASLPKWLDAQAVLAKTAIEAKSTKNYNGGEVEYQLPKNEKCGVIHGKCGLQFLFQHSAKACRLALVSIYSLWETDCYSG